MLLSVFWQSSVHSSVLLDGGWCIMHGRHFNSQLQQPILELAAIFEIMNLFSNTEKQQKLRAIIMPYTTAFSVHVRDGDEFVKMFY